MQSLPGVSCCRLTNDPNQVECSRAFGELNALFDSARRDVALRHFPHALSHSQAK